ncbi:MAG: hypothetical protein WKG07_18680 [Hymenobacter sp.]
MIARIFRADGSVSAFIALRRNPERRRRVARLPLRAELITLIDN